MKPSIKKILDVGRKNGYYYWDGGLTPESYMLQAEHLWRHIRCEDLWALLAPGSSLDSKPSMVQDVIRAAALKVLVCL